MKPIRMLLLVLLSINLLFTFQAPKLGAENPVVIHFFYDKVCAHCQLEKTELERLESIYTFLTVHYYEITDYPENNQLFIEVKAAFDLSSANTPFTVIGGVALIGYNPNVKNQMSS